MVTAFPSRGESGLGVQRLVLQFCLAGLSETLLEACNSGTKNRAEIRECHEIPAGPPGSENRERSRIHHPRFGVEYIARHLGKTE